MKAAPLSLEVPYQSQLSDENGIVSQIWSQFFKVMQSMLSPLGYEKYFEIVNNQAAPAVIEGVIFDKEKIGQASVDYLIQRVTTGGGATELIETGTFYAVYKPTTVAWVLSSTPSTAGVTLSISATGQVSYVSSNITGTASISKLTYRARILAAKNSQYSKAGAA